MEAAGLPKPNPDYNADKPSAGQQGKKGEEKKAENQAKKLPRINTDADLTTQYFLNPRTDPSAFL
jgi:hypothetical protein